MLSTVFSILPYLLHEVMSHNQWHIGVQERHLMFEGPMQLNCSALVFTHFCVVVMFQFP